MRVDMVVLIRIDLEDPMSVAEWDALGARHSQDMPGFFERRMPARSEECRHFLEDLEDRGIEFWVREERHFDLREIRDARALRSRPADTIHSVGLPHETAMDWSGVCDLCQRVPEQRGQLLVNPRKLRDKSLLIGPRGEFLVSEPVAMRMIKEGITGCLLRELRYEDDQAPPEIGFFQVLVTKKLPPVVSPPTRFAMTEDHCEACGRGGLFVDSMLYYDFDDEELADVNATFELLGEGAHLAPELIFSPRFYNLLVSAGGKLEEPEPVVFI